MLPRLIPFLQRFLALPKEELMGEQMASASLKAMINVPSALTDDFEHEKTLKDMLDFLILNLKREEV